MNARSLKTSLISMAVIALTATALYSQPPDTLWTATYGGTGSDQGKSVQQTDDGGYIVAGLTSSYGAGGSDVYLVKTDASGDTLWTQTYGGSSTDRGQSVQQTTDGGYIIAGYTMSFGIGVYDVWLIKTDASGDTLWTQTYGGSSGDWGQSVQETSSGGYIIAGYTNSFGAGSYDVYLVKTDSAGDTLWTRTYGGSSSDYGYSVQQTQDGGYIVAGHTMSFGVGGYDVWLTKTDASGDTVWTQTCGGSATDEGYSVQQTADGGYIVAGQTNSFGAGNYDVYLLKTNSSGDILWTRTLGGSSADYGFSVQQTTDAGYIIAGYTGSYGAGGKDIYLVKTDASGNTAWTQTYGGSSNDRGYSVQQTADGGYIVAGWTQSFGAGSYDFYLIRLEGECPPDLSVTLTPHDPPIQIPAGGGSFQYDAAIENTTAIPITADVWIEAIPPGGTAVPLIVRTDITFPASATITRPDLTQNVPAVAPPGLYTYVCSVGEVFVSTIDSDQFTFEKLATGEGLSTVNDWNLSGWEDEGALQVSPVEYALHQAYPNPFNPLTTISFEMRDASFVNLAVYDIFGSVIVELVNGYRQAGYHEVSFDASDLASGVYIYRIKAGNFVASGKMVLMK